MTETDAEFIARIKAAHTAVTMLGVGVAYTKGTSPHEQVIAAIPRLIGMVEERERERDEARQIEECRRDERDACESVMNKVCDLLGVVDDQDDAPKAIIDLISRAEAAESAQREAVAEVARLREALEWYGENARLCRLITNEGACGRIALDLDGGHRARAALASKE